MDGVYGEPYESGELQLRHDQIIRDESPRETWHAFGAYMMVAIGLCAVLAALAALVHSLPANIYGIFMAASMGAFHLSMLGMMGTFVVTTVILVAIAKGLFMIQAGKKELTRGPNARELK